jgi:hypothetical protein
MPAEPPMDRATASAIEVAAAILSSRSNSSSPHGSPSSRRPLTVKTLECRTWEFLDAAAANNKERVRDIIVNEQLPVTTRQWTPRRLARDLGKYWKAWGAQPGASALHCAADGGAAEVAAVLLMNNAEADATTRHGVSALHLAAFGGHVGIVHLLLSAHHRSEAHPKVDVCRACFDLFGSGGPTALHLASCGEDAAAACEIATLLLANGADVHAIDESTGRTALHYAALTRNARLCGLLVQAGAWVQACDLADETPLMLLRVQGSPTVVRWSTSPSAKAAVLHDTKQEVRRELRWTPSVRLMWLGFLEPLCDPSSPKLLQSLSRDVLRLIVDAIVASHAPPGEKRGTTEGAAEDEPKQASGEVDVSDSLAELSLAVGTMMDTV